MQPPAGSPEGRGASICAYTAVIGDITVPVATLSSLNLSGASDELANIKRTCDDDSQLGPAATRIDADWAQSRGWSGWTTTIDTSQQAILCTDDHYFSASLSDVPGSTKDDALNTILAAID
ncbi:hypothetical protein [Arthrobacter sp. ISL-30]|uniref:hypothetical protein n=1 Tax=Arthrobacter sp. ISL-30 TaxID=2819109 RepID=UPI001BEB0A5F|nr:hypothetical protein [Arthrobacter sp. ISL-30]MBT2514572.1 hypothetical protein [Arthrobacter sp. ISL-30]